MGKHLKNRYYKQILAVLFIVSFSSSHVFKLFYVFLCQSAANRSVSDSDVAAGK